MSLAFEVRQTARFLLQVGLLVAGLAALVLWPGQPWAVVAIVLTLSFALGGLGVALELHWGKSS